MRCRVRRGCSQPGSLDRAKFARGALASERERDSEGERQPLRPEQARRDTRRTATGARAPARRANASLATFLGSGPRATDAHFNCGNRTQSHILLSHTN